MLRLRSMGRKRASTSDEHCGSPLAEAASRPPTSPTRFSQTLDGFHLVPYPQGDTDFSMSAAGESPMTTPTFARIGHVSPRWEGLGDLCTLTPLPLAQLRPTPGSSCVTIERPGTSPAFSSHMTESPYHAGSSTSVHQRVAARYLQRTLNFAFEIFADGWSQQLLCLLCGVLELISLTLLLRLFCSWQTLVTS